MPPVCCFCHLVQMADCASCVLVLFAIWCRWRTLPAVCRFGLSSVACLGQPVLCGGGALLPGPGWDQEHPPSGFAIQAKEKEESGCKHCKGLTNCHNIMACVNPLLACSRLVSYCCVMHTGGSPTCVPFSPPSLPPCCTTPLADHGLCFLYLAQVVGLFCLVLAGTRSIPPLGLPFKQRKKKRAAASIVKGFREISGGVVVCSTG